MKEKIVVCENISKSYPVPGCEPLSVLHEINWEMEKGAIVAICGQSGCGKSTFMNILGLLDRQTSGKLCLAGTVFDGSNNNGELAIYRSKTIGFVFQQHHLIPELTAIQNVMSSLLIQGENASNARKKAERMLGLLFHENELKTGVANRLPERLSGGQCQRVAIARALAGSPPIVLADEPTGNLDEETGRQVFDLFLSLQKELGISVVLVTHNPAQARLADSVFRIHDKKITLDVGE